MDEARSKSQEDYLETILLVKLKKGVVRSVDIAEALGFSKPSISRAVGVLKKQGLITMDEDDFTIELTEAGQHKARKVYERHLTLRRFLLAVGLDEARAERDACEMEHVISDDTCERIEAFLQGHGY